MLEIGSLLDGKYRVLSQCGQGGMSVVYMAMNERANKTWAIKEVRKDGTQNFELVRQGLIAETEMLKQLSHPHLPSIVDVIDGEDSFLIVMDFIEGQTLKEVLDEYGPQPQESVIEWAKQLCDVLGYLHGRNPAIIYRDMKPSNVMLKPDGNIVLFDFGTAREYRAGRVEDTVALGTRGYAAPEQYGGQGQTDARTDIYCLGATMYHLLTGHFPDESESMAPIRTWNPELSGGLEKIILKCTRKDRKDRYQNCAELLYALEHYWEADEQYRKAEISKLRKFLIPAVLSIVFLAGSLTFRFLESNVKKSTYDACLTAARNATAAEEAVSNYRRAINLEPDRSEAYLELLDDVYLSDSVFTSEESEELRGILIDYGNGKQTNEIVFQGNRQEYDVFAYEAGIAYYYKFEEKSNKKNAKSYFAVAQSSQYLEPKQVERSKRLYAISDYYSRIGRVDETGDANITYRQYWDDLIALSEGNLVEIDNENTALIMYREMVSQIVSHTIEFKNDGVKKEEMDAQIENIESHLASDFASVSESNREYVRVEREKLEDSIDTAKRVIQSAFSGVREEET